MSSTSYVWGAGQDLLEDGTATYIYGPGGMLVEAVQSTTPYYYHADQLGSVRALTNQSGAVADTYTYDAYGNTSTSTGTVVNPFKYTGQYTDSETGFLYLRARYYDPATQQFLSVDPMLASTEQAYNYVGGSPVNGIDPSGLWLQYDNGEDRAYDFRLAFMMDQMGGGEFGLLGRYSMPYGRMGKPSIDDFTLKEIMESRVAAATKEAASQEETSQACPIIYRGGSQTDNALTPRPQDAGTLSFRDSLSNPVQKQLAVLKPGEKYFGIDVSKLPPGSVIFDGKMGSLETPPGHISVLVDLFNILPDDLRNAVIAEEEGRFPK